MNADVAAIPLNPARPDRMFHIGMAVAFLLTAIIGFGPTYFYKPFHAAPALIPLLHIHGVACTCWLLLFFTQSALVRAHRVDLHMRLGLFGAVLAATMVILGLMVAFNGARHGKVADGLDPFAFMIFPFGQVLMFGGFVGAALWKRRRLELHRRLILLGTICLMTPAISRIVGQRAALASMLTLIFVIVAMVHDWRTRGRVHPIYIWGGVILLVSGPFRAIFGQSALWHSIAQKMVG